MLHIEKVVPVIGRISFDDTDESAMSYLTSMIDDGRSLDEVFEEIEIRGLNPEMSYIYEQEISCNYIANNKECIHVI